MRRQQRHFATFHRPKAFVRIATETGLVGLSLLLERTLTGYHRPSPRATEAHQGSRFYYADVHPGVEAECYNTPNISRFLLTENILRQFHENTNKNHVEVIFGPARAS